MSGLFGSLGVARSALFANQLVLQTTANNVANAGRAGYSRQRVDLASMLPETLPVGQVGTGVLVAGIRRLRDRFMDVQYYQAQQHLGASQVSQSIYSQIESVLGEPSETGLQASLSKFLQSLQDLSSYPNDVTTRRTVLEQAAIVAGDFNRLSNGVIEIKRNIESEIESRVEEANGLIERIANLNRQIQTVTVAGGSPNDLMDQRDEALDSLSKLVGITRVDRKDGTIQVSLTSGGGILVDGVTGGTLGAQLASGRDDYEITLGGSAVTVSGGTLDGLLHARNDTNGYVKYTQDRLDALAVALIRQFNAIQGSGAGTTGLTSTTSRYAVSDPNMALGTASVLSLMSSGSLTVHTYDADGHVVASATIDVHPDTQSLNGLATALSGTGLVTASVDATTGIMTVAATGGSTFRFADDTSGAVAALGLNAFFAGTDARSIAVNPELTADPRRLATALPSTVTGSEGVVGAGDNQAALAMIAAMQGALPELGGATMAGHYAETVGVVGSRAAAANSLVEAQDSVAATIQNQREQVSGVSVDEEMTNMILAQRAFQAAARVVTVVDELLDTVVNGLKR